MKFLGKPPLSRRLPAPCGTALHAPRKTPFLRIWELSLLLALCVTLLFGLASAQEQKKLSRGLIRLHVIAVSDSEEDQRTKLRVRDAVLDCLTPQLENAKTPREAQEIISRALPALEALGAELANVPTRATLGWENYPTRQYEGFALPAGRYLSLRVELGAAQGKNWWCVVFPPLCAACAEDAAGLNALLDGKSVALITGESDGYVLKFRVLELWAALKDLFPA